MPVLHKWSAVDSIGDDVRMIAGSLDVITSDWGDTFPMTADIHLEAIQNAVDRIAETGRAAVESGEIDQAVFDQFWILVSDMIAAAGAKLGGAVDLPAI